MAPFSNRQIGYIRAVAGKSKHKSFITGNLDKHISGIGSNTWEQPQNINETPVSGKTFKKLTIAHWNLNRTSFGLNGSAANSSNTFTDWVPDYIGHGLGNHLGNLNLLTCDVDETAGGTAILQEVEGVDVDVPDADADGEADAQQLVDHVHYTANATTSTQFRLSPQCYLESTHMQFRFTMPDTIPHSQSAGGSVSTAMGTPHYEWRFIVFRNKRKAYIPNQDAPATGGEQNLTHTNFGQLRDGVSLLNPAYDLFMGQTGRPRGTVGWRAHPEFDRAINQRTTNIPVDDVDALNYAYCGKYWDGSAWQDAYADNNIAPPGESSMTADDYLTFRLNRNDYVIHTDERFFLGQQFGKSHYEKTIHFDWKDFIDTHNNNLESSPTLDGKNYAWHFMLIGTSNAQDVPELNVNIRATTSLNSGI